MIKILYGDEPYLIEQEKSSFIFKKEEERNVRNCDTFIEAYEFLSSTSLFDDGKKVAVLCSDTLKELDIPIFHSFLAENSQDDESDLLVILNLKNINQTTKLYKKVAAQAQFTACLKFKTEKVVANMVVMYLKPYDVSIEPLALAEFLRRMDYEHNDEVNMLTIFHEIDMIRYMSDHITIELVKAEVNDYAKGNCFELASHMLSGNTDALMLEVSRLEQEPDFSGIRLLSLLAREYGIAYKESLGYTKAQIKAYHITLAGVYPDILLRGLETINDTIRKIKNGTMDEKEALRYVVTICANELALCQNR